MARIRSIKPEFWTSETIARLSRDARLTFIGMWNESDDFGVVADNTRVLKGHLWPLDDDISPTDVALHIQQMVDEGLVLRFEAEGKRWIHISGFREHQTINKPSHTRRNPPPPGETPPLPEPSRRAPVALPEHYPEEQGTGNREQGKLSSSSDLIKQRYPQPVDDDDDERLRPTLELVAQLHAATNGKTNRRRYAATVKANAPGDGQLDDLRALLAAHPDRAPTWLADEHLARPHPPDPNCRHCGQPRHPNGPCPTLITEADR
jgi:hypothetical protein